ncbi:MAG: hypothetical protein Q7S95_00935 [bacterium]|nr:hypothetical protein [bacterium]
MDSKPDEEPSLAEGSSQPGSSKSLYSGIKDGITELDLDNHDVAKVVARTLLNETRLSRTEIAELKSFKDRFYEATQLAAVLTERIKGLNESITIRSFFFTIGGVAGGLMFNPDLASYRWPIIATSVISLMLAAWNPGFLRYK